MKQKIFHAFLILTAGLLCSLTQYYEVLFAIDHLVMDVLYQTPRIADRNIIILGIDEKTLQELGPLQTWSRGVYADLLEVIEQEAHPAVYGFDISFQGQKDEEGDKRFALAAKDKAVYVIENLQFEKKITVTNEHMLTDSLHICRIDHNYPLLSKYAGSGFSHVQSAKDGYIRNAFLQLDYESMQLDSFAWRLYKDYSSMKNLKVKEPKTDHYGRYGVRYSGRNKAYEVISFADVLNKRINLHTLDDALLLIGAYAPGMQDAYFVPIMHDGRQMYGVEIQANMIQSLLEQTTYIRMNPLWEGVLAALLCMLILEGLCRLHMKGRTIVLALSILLYLLAGILLFRQGIMISLIYVLLTLIMSYFCLLIHTLQQELKKRKELVSLFERYVDRKAVRKILSSQLATEGELRDVTILFADIRGFTALSEELAPYDVLDLLNRFLTLAQKAIFAREGMLDKYIGDAVMAVFNAPLEQSDASVQAVRCALDMLSESKVLSSYAMKTYGVELSFGIGVHCGTAIIGSIGNMQRSEYTAIGDTVNTASRVESSAKVGEILITEEVSCRLPAAFIIEDAGLYGFKGKKEAIRLYRVNGERM